MSQKDNFAGGFFLGAVLGGVVGGILGATLAQRQAQSSGAASAVGRTRGQRRRWSVLSGQGTEPATPNDTTESAEVRIEAARRTLENKIAQLNAAIDEVRHQIEDAEPVPLQRVNDKTSS